MVTELNEKFFNLPFNPEALYQKTGDYSLHYEMREDDQVGGVLKLKKLMVKGSGWDITGDESEQEQIDSIKWCIEDFPQKSFDETLYSIMSGFDFGFSLSEKCAQVVQSGPWAGKTAFAAIKTRQPDGFNFDLDDHGNLIQLTQDYEIVPYGKFVHYVNNADWESPFGRSDMSLERTGHGGRSYRSRSFGTCVWSDTVCRL